MMAARLVDAQHILMEAGFERGSETQFFKTLFADYLCTVDTKRSDDGTDAVPIQVSLACKRFGISMHRLTASEPGICRAFSPSAKVFSQDDPGLIRTGVIDLVHSEELGGLMRDAPLETRPQQLWSSEISVSFQSAEAFRDNFFLGFWSTQMASLSFIFTDIFVCLDTGFSPEETVAYLTQPRFNALRGAWGRKGRLDERLLRQMSEVHAHSRLNNLVA